MELTIYGIWYSFYGQFVFINHCIMWLFDLNDKCGTYGNPLQTTISFGESEQYHIIIFFLTGLVWDVLIYRLLSMANISVNDSIIDEAL